MNMFQFRLMVCACSNTVICNGADCIVLENYAVNRKNIQIVLVLIVNDFAFGVNLYRGIFYPISLPPFILIIS